MSAQRAQDADLSLLQIDRSKREGEEKPKKMSKGYLWISISAAFVIIIVATTGAWNSVLSPAVEVQLAVATLQTPSQSDALLSASGYVVAQRKAAVASKGTGRLVYLGVVEGDAVQANQVIARLEDNDIRAQLAEAEASVKLNQAQIEEAKNNYDRQLKLLAAQGTSQANVDAAKTQYQRVLASIDLAKAQVEAAKVAIENTVIRAPFAGTVLTKNADVGEIVAPLAAGVNSRAAVVTIADLSSLQAEADVSESNIQKVSINQDCEISVDAYQSQRYAGYVAKIVPTADRAKGTVMVKVGFRQYDERVLPEMSAKVLFLKGKESHVANSSHQVLVVPATALVTREGKQVVFKAANERAMQVEVKTGSNYGDYTEITEGLKEGDQVIAPVSDQITDGARVKIR
jgi:RND family efflux transporter MFP subunit